MNTRNVFQTFSLSRLSLFFIQEKQRKTLYLILKDVQKIEFYVFFFFFLNAYYYYQQNIK